MRVDLNFLTFKVRRLIKVESNLNQSESLLNSIIQKRNKMGECITSNERPTYNVEEAIKILEGINGMPFSEQQRAILLSTNGIKIVACAGSGKTHTIVNLVTLRIMIGAIKDPSKLLLTTYSKSGADNMSERINALLKKVGFGNYSVTVKTLHSVYYNLLMKFNEGRNLNILSESERLDLLRKATREEKVFLEEEDLGKLNSLFSYQLNNLIEDVSELNNSYVYDINLSIDSYKKIYRRFAKLKAELKSYDFDDLQYSAYDYLTYHDRFLEDREDLEDEQEALAKDYWSQAAINYLHDTYDYVIVDEFQDTSIIQYEILRKMVKSEKDLIVVGDEDQCIYSWRGAKSSILLNIDTDYHIDKLNLDTNYRCKETILEFAKLGIAYTSHREPKNMRAYKQGGSVNFVYMDSKDLYAITKKTADLIENKIKADGIAPSDIAVLVRNNAHAQVLQAILGLRGIYCSFTPDMKLSNHRTFKDIENLLGFCVGDGMNYYDKQACMGLLWKLVRYLGGDRSAQIAEIMSNTKASFIDVLEELVCSLGLDPNVSSKILLNPQIKSRLDYYCKTIKADTAKDLLTLYNLLKETDPLVKFKGLLSQYKVGTEFMFGPIQKNRQTIYREFNKKRNQDCILDFFLDLSEKGINYVSTELNKIAMYERTMSAEITNGVRITTMHSAKGLEWSHVIIMAYDNVSFPDVSYLLKKKDMQEDDRQEYLDGERRLAYVAITRAIDNLTIITDNNNMSLFLLESLGGIEKDFDVLDFSAYTFNHNYEVADRYKVTPKFTQFVINNG